MAGLRYPVMIIILEHRRGWYFILICIIRFNDWVLEKDMQCDELIQAYRKKLKQNPYHPIPGRVSFLRGGPPCQVSIQLSPKSIQYHSWKIIFRRDILMIISP